MSNKDSQVIQSSGEVISHTALPSYVIVLDEEQRQKVIQILRQIPAYIDVAKKLTEGRTYQAIFTPEVLKRLKDGSAILDEKGNGLFGALVRDVKTGRVIDHVDLKEGTPDLLNSLNQLAMQQTLANIVHRLDAIDEKITDVLQGQVNDRLAEVKSGIRLYEQAIVASDPANRHQLLHGAILLLNEGRDKLIISTDLSFIDKLPRTLNGMRFNPIWDITKHVQSKAEPVWKAAHAIIKASRYLVIAYSALNEPDSLQVSVEQVVSDVKVIQDKMGEIVNWLSPTSNWRERFTTISQDVLPNIHDLDDIPQKTIIVEFQPKEIAPPEGV